MLRTDDIEGQGDNVYGSCIVIIISTVSNVKRYSTHTCKGSRLDCNPYYLVNDVVHSVRGSEFLSIRCASLQLRVSFNYWLNVNNLITHVVGHAYSYHDVTSSRAGLPELSPIIKPL